MKKACVICALAAVTLILPSLANAAIIVTMDRQSDTVVTLTFSGSYDPNTPSARGGRMFLPLAWTGTGGTCTIGANTVLTSQAAVINGATLDNASNFPGGYPYTGYANELYLNFTVNAVAGATVTGAITLTAPAGATWAALGSTGDIWYGRNNSAVPITRTGTYTVTPEPASMALLAIGGLGLLAKRRRS